MSNPPALHARRVYEPLLTAEINRKGVLDIDVVKGCTSGIAEHGSRGCYQACYAAAIARFRGFDFSVSVVRTVGGYAQADEILRVVKAAPLGFFRIGTMGDPCHAWGETVRVVEWLAPYAIPVIVTKHWQQATDDHLNRLARVGAIINTSVSALDSPHHLSRREAELQRYAEAGGTSVARVVSCDFDTADPIGAAMDREQRRLLALRPMIDNPLRIPSTHHLARSRLVRVRKVKDLTAVRSISISPASRTYLGHCSRCPDLCGAGLLARPDVRPQTPQLSLFGS